MIGADPREIVWTSGATEANNLGIKGCAHFNQRKGKHVITSRIEHKAVLDTCRQLEREGFEVTYLDPDSSGLIQPQMVADAIREDTTVVSIMHVNNEIGTLNDIAAIGAICRERKIFFHVDSAQSAGKTPIDVEAMKVDMMSSVFSRNHFCIGDAVVSREVSGKHKSKHQIHQLVQSAAAFEVELAQKRAKGFS